MLSAHDRSLVERDASLKGLRYLLDAGSLRELLAETLAPALLEGMSVDYLRYKPGVNCIARLHLKSGFAYAKAFAADAGGKLAKARQLPEVKGPSGLGRIFLDDPAIMLHFFPNDIELPAIAEFANPVTRQPFLQRVFKTNPAWSEADYTALNYKPERRYVARLTRADGRSASIKFYCSKEFQTIRRSRKKFKLPHGLRIPQWIGGSKNHRVMAYSWLPGVTLASRITSGHWEEAYRAGEAVARLHRSEQPALDKRGTKNWREMLESLAGQLGHLIPELAGEADELAGRLAAWVQGRESQRCPIHGDFYDKQVIIQEHAIGIIDSDRIQLGDPELDLGCFMAHLERRRIDGVLSPEQVEKARAALLDGYRAAAPADFSPRDMNVYTAFNLFQLSHHPFRDRRPDWGEQTASLLARCGRLLTNSD